MQLLERLTSPNLAFYSTHQKLFELISESKVDVNFSGTTAVTCFLRDGVLFTSNVGDSRAFIGSKDIFGCWKVRRVSIDHKPNVKTEKLRIVKSGGEVRPVRTNQGHLIGPDRVWVRNQPYPGLAMSRSIGDRVAASVGVIWAPGIIISKSKMLLKQP